MILDIEDQGEKGRQGKGEGKTERGKETEREKHCFVVPLIYAFMGCFLHVPSPGIKLQHWHIGMIL